MKVSVLEDHLTTSLANIRPFVATNGTLPITRNVLLSTGEGMLKVQATDLEKRVSVWLGATVEKEGSATVPYTLFRDSVASMGNDRIDLKAVRSRKRSEVTLDVKSSAGSVEIRGSKASDFPKGPEFEAATSVTFDPDDLAASIERVLFAAATEESRPVLTGVLFDLAPSKYRLVAADGFRLAIQSSTLVEGTGNQAKVIVPGRTLATLPKLLRNLEEPVTLELNEAGEVGRFLIQREPYRLEIITDLLRGDYPDYEALVPQEYEWKAQIPTASLKRAVEGAAVMARDGNNVVRFELAPAPLSPGHEAGEPLPARLVVSSRGEDSGRASQWADCGSVEGFDLDDQGLPVAPRRIAFNFRLLPGVFRAVGDGSVELAATSESSPGVWRVAGEDSFTCVVMPMFVQWDGKAGSVEEPAAGEVPGEETEAAQEQPDDAAEAKADPVVEVVGEGEMAEVAG